MLAAAVAAVWLLCAFLFLVASWVQMKAARRYREAVARLDSVIGDLLPVSERHKAVGDDGG